MANIIKWRGGDDDRHELVKRVQKIAEGESKELVRREPSPPARRIEAPPPVLPVPVRSPEAEIIQPEIWTPPRPNVQSFAPGSVARDDHPPLLLPRWCAMYDGEMGLAVYLWRNGYVYSDSIEPTPAQKRRYASENAAAAVPDNFYPQRERCAICGKWTPDDAVGAVSCGRCHTIRVCFGRTTPDGYFQCRPSCGRAEFLETSRVTDSVALVLGRSRGNFGTGF